MKRLALIVLLLGLIFFGVSCSNEVPGGAGEDVTAWIPPTTTEPTTESTIPDPDIKSEKATMATTKPGKKPHKTKNKNEATESTTQQVPTQGVTKPGRHIVVTTVKGSIGSGDFDFIYKSLTIRLNESIDKIFGLVGEDNVSTELGKGKMEYEYPDFTLKSYTDENGVERLEQITVTDDNIATAKGAKPGVTYGTELRRIYGDPNVFEKKKVIYTSGAKSLMFEVEDNIVVTISYKYTH